MPEMKRMYNLVLLQYRDSRVAFHAGSLGREKWVNYSRQSSSVSQRHRVAIGVTEEK